MLQPKTFICPDFDEYFYEWENHPFWNGQREFDKSTGIEYEWDGIWTHWPGEQVPFLGRLHLRNILAMFQDVLSPFILARGLDHVSACREDATPSKAWRGLQLAFRV
jgi:hypothetical protein